MIFQCGQLPFHHPLNEESEMRGIVSSAMLILCVLTLSGVTHAQEQEEVRARPVDIYISGFGGYSFPLNTDSSSRGVTVRDLKLDDSPAFGGKIGIWFIGPRKALGLDFGTEIDVTNLDPDIARGQILQTDVGGLAFTTSSNLNATYFGMNVLVRYPVGVTQDLPNGRWFPYIGIGGGGLRLTFQGPGITKSWNTSPAFQGIGGVKVFSTKHIAAFAEGKFIHASNSIEFQEGGSIELNVNSFHGTGGLSLHF